MKLAKPSIVYPFSVRVWTLPPEEFSKGGLQATTNQRVDLLFVSLPQALNFLSMLFGLSRVLHSYGVRFEGLFHRIKTREVHLIEAEKVFGNPRGVVFTDAMNQLLADLSKAESDCCKAVYFSYHVSGKFEIGIRAGGHPPRLSQFRYPSEALRAVETFRSNEVFFRKLGLYFYSFEYRPEKMDETFPLMQIQHVRPRNGPIEIRTTLTPKLAELLEIYKDREKPIELPKPEAAVISEIQLA